MRFSVLTLITILSLVGLHSTAQNTHVELKMIKGWIRASMGDGNSAPTDPTWTTTATFSGGVDATGTICRYLDNYCVPQPGFPPFYCPNEYTYNDVIVSFNGNPTNFNISNGITLSVNLDAWESDHGDQCTYQSGDDDRSQGSTIIRLPPFSPDAVYPYTYDFSITTANNSFRVDYRLTVYNIDALVGTKLRYANSGGTTQSVFCTGDPVRIYADYQPGYNSGRFQWQQLVGGTWQHYAYTTNNYLEIPASTSIPTFRARTYISCFFLCSGGATSDGFLDNINQPITVLPAPPALNDIVTTVTGACIGSSNGSIAVNLNNATSSATYRMTCLKKNNSNQYVVVGNAVDIPGSAPTYTFSGLSAGTYRISVTMVSGSTTGNCTTQKSDIPLPELGLPVISAAPVGGSCFGDLGRITVSVTSNSTTSNTFVLMNASNTVLNTQTVNASSYTFDNLAPATYKVRATNSNGCGSTTLNAVVPASPSAITATISIDNFGGTGYQIMCLGGTGLIRVTPTGGTPPYTVSVTGGGDQTNVVSGQQVTFNRPAGGYTITITDTRGCTNTTPYSANLLEPPTQLFVNASNLIPTSDCANVGSATLNGSGGVPPYQYKLEGAPQFVSGNVFNNLSAGNFTGYIRDAAGCQSTVIFTIGAPSPLVVEPSIVSNASCSESSNGEVVLTASGGTGGYTFSIDNGPFGSNPVFSNLTQGTYTFHVQDQLNCQDDVQVSVGAPAPIVITSATPGSFDCQGTTTSLTVSITGRANGIAGDLNMEISLNNGQTYQPLDEYYDDGLTSQTTIYDLPYGTYQVRVRELSCSDCPPGCAMTGPSTSVTITQPVAFFATLGAITHETCPGANDGTITVNFGGGSPPYRVAIYTFSFNEANIVASYGPTMNNTYTFTNLPPSIFSGNPGPYNGGYAIAVYDGAVDDFSSMCNIGIPTGFGSYPYTFTPIDILPNQPINVNNIQSTGPLLNCYGNNGVITVGTPTGGTPPYQYSLDGQDFQTSNVFTGCGAQNTIYVKDNRGCVVGPFNASVPVAPVTLNVSASMTAPETSCTRGSIQMNISGGTAPFEVLLRQGPCNGNFDGATIITNNTSNFTNLEAGDYSICVRDAGGCTDFAFVTIAEISPPDFEVTNVQNATCLNNGNNGVISLHAEGGTAPYTITINNGNPQTGNASTNFTFNNLGPGTYLFILTDATGCSVFLTQQVFSNNQILTDVFETPVSGCGGAQNGEIGVMPIDGQPPFTITWQWDNTTSTNVALGQTVTRTGLAGGVYNILITDSQGCSRAEIAIIDQPLPLFANLVTNNPLCSNVMNGSVTVNAGGGTSPLEYSLDGGTYQPSNIFAGVDAGNHMVTVRDANSCTADFNFTLSYQRTLVANATPTAPNCFGGNNGTIGVAVTGGGSPYTFSVNGGGFNLTNPIPNLMAGIYNVTIRDNGGCETTLSNIQIMQPTQLTATVNLIQDATCGQNTGILQAVGGGGTPNYSYQWNGNSSLNNATLNNAPAGLNTVIITDSKGCTASASGTITNIPTVSLSLAGTTNETCDQMNGSASVNTQGGTPPFTFSWSHNTSLNSPTASGLSSGSYMVTVTDGNNCSATFSLTVGENQGPSATSSVQNSLCANGNGSITLSTSGGLPPYNYTWSHAPALNAPMATGLNAGNYSATITDANGCIFISSATVNLLLPPVANAIPAATNCQGNTGSIQITLTGGTAPFNYSWSHNPNLNSNIAGNLAAGNYSCTVTDANGCLVTTSATITELPPPNIFINAQSASCSQPNGSAVANISGGTAPYTYAWSSGNPNNPQANNLAPGNYTLTITDFYGCQDIESFTIGNIPGPTAVNATVQNSVCSNFNGSITVSPVGGMGPFTYSWSQNIFLNSPTANLLQGGTYTVTITDNNNCQITSTQTVLFQPPPTVQTIQQVNSLCTNGNGIIEIAPQGTGPFTYHWTNQVSTGPLAQNLNAGSYTVTVTDGNACNTIRNYTIALEPGPAIQLLNQVNDQCSQGIGSIRVRGVGGAQPYTFSWSHNPSLNSDQATGLVAGTYMVTITDQHACSVVGTYVITSTAGPTLSISNITTAFCGNPVGSATVAAAGGFPPYTYAWSQNPGLNSNFAGNLLPGTYTVTVTDSHNCMTSTAVVVPGTTGPAVSLVSTSDNPCILADGQITVAGSGGAAPLTYSWSHNPALNSPMATGLATGSYTVTVTDVNGCSAILTTSITDRRSPQLQVVNTLGSTCGAADGSVTVAASLGQSPYTYAWSQNPSLNSPTANNLAAGSYSVTVTDANGCTATTVAVISDTQGPQAIVQNLTNATCTPNSGAITIGLSGGSAPFNYSWSHNPGLNSPTATGLSAGTYTVTVTDGNGCTAVSSNSIVYFAPPTATPTVVNAICTLNSGSISVAVNNGTGPYNIQWANTGLSGFNVSALFAGNYAATVTDANGCTASFTAPVAFIAGPDPVIADQQDASCGQSNGLIDIGVFGGTLPYTYSWSHQPGLNNFIANNLQAGNYSVTVTDANHCTGTLSTTIHNTAGPVLQISTDNSACGQSSGSATVSATGGALPLTYSWSHNANLNSPNATGLAAGNYTVTVTDANGCSSNIEGEVSDDNAANLTVGSFSNALCTNNNGSIMLTASGGTSPFTYTWSHNPGLNSPNATGLSAGTYSATITDGNGCQDVVSKTLTFTAGPALSLASASNSICNDGNGEISFQATGGTTPYNYSWSHSPGLNSSHAGNLTAGTYTMTVTDAGGCTTSLQAATTLIAGPQATLGSVTDAYCNNNGGAVTINTSGGATPYTYSWSHNQNLNSNTAFGLVADDYSVTVHDANGCVSNVVATVADVPGFTLSASQVQPTTCGNNDGQVTVTTSGGQAPFQYQWSHDPGLNSATASNLPVEVYFVTVTDNSGCEQVVSAAVQASDGPNLTIASAQDATCSASNGSISTTISGGTGPYTYQWSNGLSTPNASGLAGGTYQISVTDINGCPGAAVVTLAAGEAPDLQLLSATETSCAAPTGQVSVTAFNGQSPYTFTWSHDPGLQGTVAGNLAAGDYSVTLTDATGCSTDLQATVEQNTDLAVALQQTESALCASPTGSITVAGQGGLEPYSFSWSHDPNLDLSQAQDLVAGNYIVSITDAEGCEAVLGITVGMQNTNLSVSEAQNTPAACNAPTGAISLTTAGGTAPYTYAWSHDPNETDAMADNLGAGTYAATVTDANGCTGVISATVGTTPAPQLSVVQILDTDCNQSTGSIEVSPTGGQSPYTFAWSHSASETSNLATGLGADNYTVTVTDANGCSTSLDAAVSALGAPDATVSAMPSYCSQPSGEATVTVTTPGTFTYAWENNNNPGVTIATDATATNLPAGNYAVTIEDQSGCERVLNVSINDLPNMVITAGQTAVTCFGNADGTASVTVASSGTAPFNYLWSNNAMTSAISNLIPGNYQVTVTDDNGCTATQSVNITQPTLLGLSLTNSVQPNCSASGNGSLAVQANGGTSPYTYHWSNNQNGASLSGLTAGTYSVTATDANGCTATFQTTLTPVGDLNASVATTTPTCVDTNDGEASVTVGGAGPFTYQWNVPGNPSGSMVSGLAPGNYQVTVSNTGGCSTVRQFTIDAPVALTLNTQNTPSCLNELNGTAIATAIGGAGGYTYQWSNLQQGASIANLLPGVYTVTATDANGCTISEDVIIDGAPFPSLAVDNLIQPDCAANPTGTAAVTATGGTGAISYQWDDPAQQMTATATGLTPGNYHVIAIDVNGCSANLDVQIDQPADLVASIGALSQPSCNGSMDGTATVTVQNPSGTYSYQWSDAAQQTTQQATGLAAGNYSVTVTNNEDGCSTSVDITIPEPAIIQLSLQSATAPLCNGQSNGNAQVTASGGTAGYSYQWDDPANQTTPLAVNLPSGTYMVTATDTHGCTTSLQVEVPQTPVLNASISSFNGPLCFGEANGNATALATGGTGTYSYHWNDLAAQTTAQAINLTPGQYSVTIQDANGCQSSTNVTIPATPQIVITVAEQAAPSCTGLADGQITVSATGGTGTLSYEWSGGQMTPDLSNLLSGSYTVSVTDANGCLATQTISLADAVALTVTGTSSTAPLCYNSTDGSATVTVQGGTGTFTYAWNDPANQTTQTAQNLGIGTYTVVATDGNGCSISQNINVTTTAQQIIVNGNIAQLSCDGATNGQITVSAQGGAGGFVFVWQGGQTVNNLSGLTAGTYFVTATDAHGCSQSAQFELLEGQPFEIDLGPADTVLCQDEFLFVDFTGQNYTVNWTSFAGFTSSNALVMLENTDTYYVQVTNVAGCTARDTIAVQATTVPFNAFFVAPTDVVVNQEVRVVEASWPVPNDVRWHYDPTKVQLVRQDQDQYFFRFTQTGEISLTMQGLVGGCEDWLTKIITVHQDSTTIPSLNPQQPDILSFTLSPNPNSGVFNANVLLSAPMDVVMGVYDLNGILKERRILRGQNTYSENFSLGLQPGVHLLILQTPRQRKTYVFTAVTP